MAEGYKDWSAGDILTAADLEDYTVKQSVMRFDDSSARTTALSGVLAEGMVSYLKDTDTVEVYDGSAWGALAGGKILQLVHDYDTSTITTTSTSFVATNASVTITPSAATSKIFLIGSVYAFFSDVVGDDTYLSFDRDGTTISAETRYTQVVANRRISTTLVYLDSPSSTSALTYTLDYKVSSGTATIQNAHSITALEVSA